ncbi:MAG: DUF4124 domain-containing protein [Bdellovibrio sp.]|nr:DUF4124 domain-containing protein [Methylotenera sp.]
MKNVIWALLLSALAVSHAASADSKILKWVDKQGVTHYGDRPPSFEESKSNIEINGRGQMVKKNDYTVKKINEQDLQVGNQDRKDKILLASYSNANEIDLARERSLEMNKAALTSLASQKENLTARIARNNATADGFKKRNKPLPVNLDKEFKDAIASSSLLDKQMAGRKLEMEQTNKNYTQDKARFLELKQPVAAVEAAPITAPIAESPPVEKIAVEKLRIDKK